MEFIPVNNLSQLEAGDIIRSKSSLLVYVVAENYGTRATAVRTVDVTNPIEWEAMRKEKYSPQDFAKDEAHYRNSH